MRYALAAATIIMAVAAANNAHAIDCERFLKTHGFLSRAQFQCGFDKYPQGYIEQARECSGYLGEARIKEELAAGFKTFDDREVEEGRKALCARVRKSFPQVFGR